MSQISLISKEFNIPIKECKHCRGTGIIHIFCGCDSEEECPHCHGKGYITIKRRDDRDLRKKAN